MNKDSDALVSRIRGNEEIVEKSISSLEDLNVFNYTYSLLSEKLFKGEFDQVENKSDFLNGAFFAMQELSTLPDKVKEVRQMMEEASEDDGFIES